MIKKNNNNNNNILYANSSVNEEVKLMFLIHSEKERHYQYCKKQRLDFGIYENFLI